MDYIVAMTNRHGDMPPKVRWQMKQMFSLPDSVSEKLVVQRAKAIVNMTGVAYVRSTQGRVLKLVQAKATRTIFILPKTELATFESTLSEAMTNEEKVDECATTE